MEIIRKGVIRQKYFRGTCSSCKCEIRCTKDELSDYYPGDQHEGELGTVSCPMDGCPHNINVYPEKE